MFKKILSLFLKKWAYFKFVIINNLINFVYIGYINELLKNYNWVHNTYSLIYFDTFRIQTTMYINIYIRNKYGRPKLSLSNSFEKSKNRHFKFTYFCNTYYYSEIVHTLIVIFFLNRIVIIHIRKIITNNTHKNKSISLYKMSL